MACYELGNNTNLIGQAVKIHDTVNNKIETLLTLKIQQKNMQVKPPTHKRMCKLLGQQKCFLLHQGWR